MPVHILWGMTDDLIETTGEGRPETQVLHPLPETDTEELIPGVTANNQDVSLVPTTQVLEPLPETDTEELRPSIITEEED